MRRGRRRWIFAAERLIRVVGRLHAGTGGAPCQRQDIDAGCTNGCAKGGSGAGADDPCAGGGADAWLG